MKTTVLQIGQISTKKIVKTAVDALNKGSVIVFPTETSYGLGVDATNKEAVAKLIKAKKQPPKKEISVIVDSLKTIEKYCEISGKTRRIATCFFPAPLTLIAPKKKNVLPWLGLYSLAFRVPANEIALKLCKGLGKPITATSANIHGKPALFKGISVVEAFSGKVSLIIDAGTLEQKKPSTLYDVVHKTVLRKGQISEKEIKKALK